MTDTIASILEINNSKSIKYEMKNKIIKLMMMENIKNKFDRINNKINEKDIKNIVSYYSGKKIEKYALGIDTDENDNYLLYVNLKNINKFEKECEKSDVNFKRIFMHHTIFPGEIMVKVYQSKYDKKEKKHGRDIRDPIHTLGKYELNNNLIYYNETGVYFDYDKLIKTLIEKNQNCKNDCDLFEELSELSHVSDLEYDSDDNSNQNYKVVDEKNNNLIEEEGDGLSIFPFDSDDGAYVNYRSINKKCDLIEKEKDITINKKDDLIEEEEEDGDGLSIFPFDSDDGAYVNYRTINKKDDLIEEEEGDGLSIFPFDSDDGDYVNYRTINKKGDLIEKDDLIEEEKEEGDGLSIFPFDSDDDNSYVNCRTINKKEDLIEEEEGDGLSIFPFDSDDGDYVNYRTINKKCNLIEEEEEGDGLSIFPFNSDDGAYKKNQNYVCVQ